MIHDWWREWLESLALFYRVSSLKMFKTAFPPGWIGKHKKLSQNFKYQIWIESQIDLEFNNDDLTKKERSLINILRLKGKWQSELLTVSYTNLTLPTSDLV